MNSSTLKILVPFGLLIAVVFAVTYFSQYTPTEPDDQPGLKAAGKESPLRFFASSRQWNPISSSLQDQIFPGYFELGTRQTTTFWFENRNPLPVAIQLEQASCSSCSGASVAAIPRDDARFLLQMTALSVLPTGFLSSLPATGMIAPAANLFRDKGPLAWQRHDFKDKNPAEVNYSVPQAANADGWSPQWGILELSFVVKNAGRPSPLTTTFRSKVEGTDQSGTDQFVIVYQAGQPLEVDKSAIETGELTDTSPTQMHEVLLYSTTRDLAPGDVSIRVDMPPGEPGEPGGFVSTGSPVLVPPAELEAASIAVSVKLGQPVRVRSALKVPVVVKVRDGDARLDIGPLNRVIWVTQGSEQRQVAVRGSMRGAVYLGAGKAIELGAFSFDKGITRTFDVMTERTGVELELVRDQVRPKFLQITLKKLPDSGGRGHYQGELVIPAFEQQGEIRDGVVVVGVKGPNPQRIRIPVTGRGR